MLSSADYVLLASCQTPVYQFSGISLNHLYSPDDARHRWLVQGQKAFVES